MNLKETFKTYNTQGIFTHNNTNANVFSESEPFGGVFGISKNNSAAKLRGSNRLTNLINMHFLKKNGKRYGSVPLRCPVLNFNKEQESYNDTHKYVLATSAKLRLWSCIASFILLSLIACINASAQDKLAVINTKGEVWVRDLSSNSIGGGAKLTGPGLFGGPDDQFVVTFINDIPVVTRSGEVWSHGTYQQNQIGGGNKVSGSVFGGTDGKYVFSGPDCGYAIYVVTNGGDVWIHSYASQYGIGAGKKLSGPSLFGGSNDKYVVHDGYKRILVINTSGEVWAHDLSSSTSKPAGSLCRGFFDTIGDGYKLTGPSLFGGANDSYVVSYGGRLLVINSLGEVWARDISGSSVGPGVKLNGPGLFGTPNDSKYVVAYRYNDPPK